MNFILNHQLAQYYISQKSSGIDAKLSVITILYTFSWDGQKQRLNFCWLNNLNKIPESI